jgi:ParB family transcriptional regulator, chromosome partitioning protein
MVAKKQRRGLGRGLTSLLGEDVPAVAAGKDVITEIDIEKLVAGKYQPRSNMEMERLKELADSIREQGVINPIVVRPTKGGKYEIIAGERRFRASKIAERKTVPAIVRKVQDKDALAMALIENMQREDLNAMEEAQGIRRLIDEFDYTHEQAAQAIGRSRPATSNLLRLLTLAKPVQRLLADSKIEMGHARALLPLTGAEQIELSNEIIAKRLSVREAERIAERRKEEKTRKPIKKIVKKSRDDQILEERLSEALGAPVRLVLGRRGKGQIVIDFANLDDLDAIVSKISPEY